MTRFKTCSRCYLHGGLILYEGPGATEKSSNRSSGRTAARSDKILAAGRYGEPPCRRGLIGQSWALTFVGMLVVLGMLLKTARSAAGRPAGPERREEGGARRLHSPDTAE